MKKFLIINIVPALILVLFAATAFGASEAFKDNIYNPGQLKPVDSTLKVKIGEAAPDFTLPSVAGDKISLSQYRGKKHVVISFVPAAWTPDVVCLDQSDGGPVVSGAFRFLAPRRGGKKIRCVAVQRRQRAGIDIH